MMDYSLTKTRTVQWILIILVLAAIAGGYFYYRSKAAVTMKTTTGTSVNPVRVFLTSGTSWTVPADFNANNNTIECVGAGGNGVVSPSGQRGAGGGGGEYRKITNFSTTAGSSISYAIASGGSQANTTFNTNSLICDAGDNGSGTTAGPGGTGGTGGTGYNGGNGGTGATYNSGASGGGGGAAGPGGVGKNGGGSGGGNRAGSGGGGAGGGSATAGADAGAIGVGGNGGTNRLGTGAGVGAVGCTGCGGNLAGSAGTAGGGGGGGGGHDGAATSENGGNGGAGNEWDATHGAGGGGGSAGGGTSCGSGRIGGNGGLYGGGGGATGVGWCSHTAGVGAQGVIVITYYPIITKINTSPNSSITSGLVGHWTFDGADTTTTIATDRGSGGNNGTLTNGPVPTIGKIGQALSFDGTNDYVNIPQAASINPSQLTLSAWIKTTVSSGDYKMIINTNKSSWLSYSLYIVSGQAIFAIGYTGSPPYAAAIGSTNIVNDGAWHHLSGTYDGTTMNLYVDGLLQSSYILSQPILYEGAATKLGQHANEAASLYSGLMDDVRIYNRALSATEIQSLYQLGEADTINSSQGDSLTLGLTGYWKLDDGSGTAAADASGNSYTGTFDTTPTWGAGQVDGAASFSGGQYGTIASNIGALDSVSASTVRRPRRT